MTPKIRIGNDIVIRATVLRLGQPEDFTGKEVRLWLCSYSTRTELPFTLTGNCLTATWYGTEQTQTGTYRLTLEVRQGDRSLNTADECAAFQLVPRSCAENCLTGTQQVSARLDVGTETRDIDLSISTPANGLSAYEVALHAGFQGTEAEWLASLKGEQGEQGPQGDAFEYADLTPAQIAELQKPATDAAKEAQAVSQAAQQQENDRKAAEAQRAKDETARQTAETQRQAAETERATEFAGWEAEIAGKQDAFTTDDSLSLTSGELSVTQQAKRALFIEQWNNAAGRFGRYNPDTDLFELNGLTDITWPQAYDIFRDTAGQGFETEALFRGMKIRTNLPMRLPDYSDSLHWFCYGCTEMEVVRIFGGYGETSDFVAQNLRLAFFNCTKLRVIYGVIQVWGAINGTEGNTTDMFYACRELEEVYIKYLSVNMDFKYLQKLKLECFEYMIANAAAKSPITITVHPDVYAKITDEANAGWHALIAAAQEKQITFATV